MLVYSLFVDKKSLYLVHSLEICSLSLEHQILVKFIFSVFFSLVGRLASPLVHLKITFFYGFAIR